ncbi:uncharacterized protein F4822DRAFT_118995 [Hypoxylon trugodes]|uniref:uncharacterized protein n=1 Tax=Hypoxylon trugodes TaxID=326681 RepID=UPI00219EE6FF|nr:uncharacterized protein F4822DRAFT_118995 [Hypoxylon trugodes]KAI1392198.1 hypothetical protein F4822DRAFT_118995 [Hypoxylon trugodes]
MASPTQDHRASLSPFAPPHMSRSYDPRNPLRIIVEPTAENQRIYNEIRQTHERTRLQTHVASQQNLLPNPAAPSVSTAHSPIDDPETPSTQDLTAQERERHRKPRGRRRGPLKDNTRLNTALKRKLKLACPHHRAKKITCDCHDFSKLEENYRSSLIPQSSSRGISHERSEIMPHMSSEQELNRETFGTGGAATGPPDQDPTSNDFIDLSPLMSDHEDIIRFDVQQIVSRFNSDAIYLDETMLQGPGQTYHPGNDMTGQSPNHVNGEFLEIGSQRHDYPNRWQCEYKGSVDTMSDTSSERSCCCWTGPFDQLSDHFRTKHHTYHDMSPRFWFVCTLCHAKAKAPDDLERPALDFDFRCTRESCSGSYQRWYYGSTRDESVLGSVVVTESEAGYSWNANLEGNQPWLGGGSMNGGYIDNSGAGNLFEHYQYHNAKWDTSSDASGLRPTRKDRFGCCRSKRGKKTPTSSSHQCPILLLRYGKLPVGYLISIVVPVLATIIQESSCLMLSLCTASMDAIGWCSLVLLLTGFIATWVMKDRTRAYAIDELSHRPRGRHRPRNRIPSVETSVWHGFRVVAVA